MLVLRCTIFKLSEWVAFNLSDDVAKSHRVRRNGSCGGTRLIFGYCRWREKTMDGQRCCHVVRHKPIRKRVFCEQCTWLSEKVVEPTFGFVFMTCAVIVLFTCPSYYNEYSFFFFFFWLEIIYCLKKKRKVIIKWEDKEAKSVLARLININIKND